ncbi:MAG TPA: hypothetical protein VLL72_02385 [Kiloniellales bacterium]|nr:hypothetical protein [Kiloniellales bacterium]
MTEDDSNSRKRPPAEEAGFASPPCFLHELDPSYLGFLTEAEVAAGLADLRALARGALAGVATGPAAGTLRRLAERLGAELEGREGAAPGPAAKTAGSPEQLVAALAAFAPKVGDPALHARLKALEAELRAVTERPAASD